MVESFLGGMGAPGSGRAVGAALDLCGQRSTVSRIDLGRHLLDLSGEGGARVLDGQPCANAIAPCAASDLESASSSPYAVPRLRQIQG